MNTNPNHRHNGMLQRNCVTVLMYAFILSPTYMKQLTSEIMDKTPTHALFTEHYISLAC